MEGRDQHHPVSQEPRDRLGDRPSFGVESREIVEARDLRVALQQRFDVDDALERRRVRSPEDLKALEGDLAAGAAVGLHSGHNDIRAALAATVRLLEHGDGGAAPTGVSEVDAQACAAGAGVERSEERVRVGSLILRVEWTASDGPCTARDDVHAHVGQLRDQPVDQPAAKPLANAGVWRLADDHVLDRQLVRHGDDGVGDLAGALDEPALQQLGELLRLRPALVCFFVTPAEHDEHGAEAAEPAREAARASDERTAAGASADRDEDVLRGRPDGAACAADRLRDEAERDLPQRRKVAGPEEVRERGVDLLRGIDVAVTHALAQRLGRDVDELDLIGMVQHLVGEGLAHGNARDVLGEVLD